MVRVAHTGIACLLLHIVMLLVLTALVAASGGKAQVVVPCLDCKDIIERIPSYVLATGLQETSTSHPLKSL
jgi:hypothetical protein